MTGGVFDRDERILVGRGHEVNDVSILAVEDRKPSSASPDDYNESLP